MDTENQAQTIRSSVDYAAAAWRWRYKSAPGEWHLAPVEFYGDDLIVEPLYTAPPRPDAQSDARLRCLITGNPCGTDTWEKNSSCKCANCQTWLAQSDAEPAGLTERIVRALERRRFTDQHGRYLLTQTEAYDACREALAQSAMEPTQNVRAWECKPKTAEWGDRHTYLTYFRELSPSTECRPLVLAQSDAEPAELTERIVRALERRRFTDQHGRYLLTQTGAYEACREALAQSNAEPVAWRYKSTNTAHEWAITMQREPECKSWGWVVEPLYTAPPRPDYELSAIAAAIGSSRFMDPPDGGNVSLAEQVCRMRESLERAEAAVTLDEIEAAMDRVLERRGFGRTDSGKW